MNWVQLLIPLLGGSGFFGGLVLLLKARSENKKIYAEAHKVNSEGEKVSIDGAAALTAATLTLIQPFRDQVLMLTERCTVAETKVRVLVAEMDRLNERVRDLSDDLDYAHTELMKNGIPIPPRAVIN